jgi:hypothetical protein
MKGISGSLFLILGAEPSPLSYRGATVPGWYRSMPISLGSRCTRVRRRPHPALIPLRIQSQGGTSRSAPQVLLWPAPTGFPDLRHRKIPRTEFLIATVPDPKETRLDDIFDHYVDAIQRACEEADWEFDRYSLPWRTSKDDSSSAQKPAGPGIRREFSSSAIPLPIGCWSYISSVRPLQRVSIKSR